MNTFDFYDYPNEYDNLEPDETVTTLADVNPTKHEERLTRQQALSYFGYQAYSFKL